MPVTLTDQDFQNLKAFNVWLTGFLSRANEPKVTVPAPPAAPTATPLRLTEDDYKDAAGLLNCEVACIKAVRDVESRGYGFVNGRPLVLFEPHIFSKYSNHEFDDTHGGVSRRHYQPGHYPKGTAEEQNAANWAKIEYAAGLNKDAAYMAASYGMFQVMGFNFRICGFRTVHDFVTAMHQGERAQLMACVQYILSNRLDDELRSRDWKGFAAGYNGPAYATNNYHTKLEAAYAKHAGASGK